MDQHLVNLNTGAESKLFDCPPHVVFNTFACTMHHQSVAVGQQTWLAMSPLPINQ